MAKRLCQVCKHGERHRIEALRVAGTTAQVLVTRFGLGNCDAVYRHMDKCVSAQTKAAIIADVPVQELAERAVAESMSLLDYLALTRKVLTEQMLGAASINDRSGVAKTAGRLLDALREIGRLTGELVASPLVSNVTNNYVAVMASPVFIDLEAMLAERLGPFPDARLAVLAGLQELEARQAPQARAPTSPPMLEGSLAA